MKQIWVILFLVLAAMSAAAQDVNIVYIGNSITQGVLLDNAEVSAPPAQASRYIEKQRGVKVKFRNCGVSGMTTLNFMPKYNQLFPNVKRAASDLSSNPGILVFSISLGTNDSAGTMAFGAPVSSSDYSDNMKSIIDELLRLYPQCKVVVQSPIWYSPNTYNAAQYLAAGLKRLEGYRAVLVKMVEEYGKTRPGRVYLGDTKAFSYFKKHYKPQIRNL